MNKIILEFIESKYFRLAVVTEEFPNIKVLIDRKTFKDIPNENDIRDFEKHVMKRLIIREPRIAYSVDFVKEVGEISDEQRIKLRSKIHQMW